LDILVDIQAWINAIACPSPTNRFIPGYEGHVCKSVSEEDMGIDEARCTCANDPYRFVKHGWGEHDNGIIAEL
jgi:peroxiredoxin